MKATVFHHPNNKDIAAIDTGDTFFIDNLGVFKVVDSDTRQLWKDAAQSRAVHPTQIEIPVFTSEDGSTFLFVRGQWWRFGDTHLSPVNQEPLGNAPDWMIEQ